jgi:hypothetical protein
VVTLIASSGYTFTGLPANAFSHTGAPGGVSSAAGSGAVTISFAPTGKIAVENYNLQDYVPVPAAGDRAVKAVTNRNDLGIEVVWKDAVGTDKPNEFDRFELGEVYQAEITLTAKNGYEFVQSFEYPAGTINVLNDDNSNADSSTLTVTYYQTQAPTMVTETNLAPYIPKPVTDGTPVSYFTASTNQYTGSVAWKKTGDANVHAGLFAAGTAYTAVVSLHPAAGYTLEGLNPNSFTYTGASSVIYDETAGTVTVEFGETDERPITGVFDLTPYLPAPVAGATPAASSGLHLPMAPFTGTVTWKQGTSLHTGAFAAGTAYTVEVALTPHSGYTLTGLTNNSFIHTGASSVDYTAGSATVTVYFPATAAAAALTKVNILDLTPYLAKPVSGGTPIPAIYTSQYTGTVSWNPAHSLFAADTAYTATVTMTPAAGYTFTGVTGFTYDGQNLTPSDNTGNSCKVTIAFPATPKTLINGPIDLTLYLPAPAAGAAPATSLTILPGSNFTGGTVAWKKGNNPHTGPFAADTAYTATVTLTPAAGYAFAGGVAFTHSKQDGTPTVTTGDSRTVTIKFLKPPITMITELRLLDYIPNPAIGERQVTHFEAPGYSGDIHWQNTGSGGNGDFFAVGGIYSAEIILSALPGYGFDPARFLATSKLPGSTNGYVYGSSDVSSIQVVDTYVPERLDVTFYFEDPLTTSDILLFGSADTTADSARKLMKDKSNESSLEIVLSDGAETIAPFTFTKGTSSPGAVVINGNGRVLQLGSVGSIMTVESGVTLTLRNITLVGRASNNAPLVKVNTGGTLKLESGAVIRDNVSSVSGGGVLVSGGGTLQMTFGAVIRENTSLTSGGGVSVGTTTSGTLIMDGGTITANTANIDGGGVELNNSSASTSITGGTISDNQAGRNGGGIWAEAVNPLTISNVVIRNNAATGSVSTSPKGYGGGIYVRNMTVTMTDCFVTGNTAQGSGGGMRVDLSTFTMENGTIMNNTGQYAGGISVLGTFFIMKDGVISSNTATSDSNNNGVYLNKASDGTDSTFRMLESARVDSSNNIFIVVGSAIEVLTNQLTSAAPVANITSTGMPSGTQILIGSGISQYHTRFKYNGSYTITNMGKTP